VTESTGPLRGGDAHRYVVDAVSQLVTSDDWIAMLRAAQQFREYSPRNTMLLALQGAQGRVAGYRAWQSIPSSDGGYCQVSQGARSLKILAPTLRRDVVTDPATGDERRVQRLTGWRVVSVFDERALVAPPVPADVAPKLLDGAAPQGVWDALAEQVTLAGYALVDRDVSPANGLTDFLTRIVAVRSDLPELQRVKTLTHELAHVAMHGPETRPEGLDRAVAEIEAESVAFLVLADLGIDASAYTLPYVARWADGDHELVASTATRVIVTARTVSDSIERTLFKEDAMTPMSQVEPGPAWTVTTGAGVWTIGYDTETHGLVARHDIDGAPNLAVGHDVAVTSVGMLESALGFAIPQEVGDDLRKLQPSHRRSADTHVEPLDLAPSERPTSHSSVGGPDGEIATYGSLIDRELIDRSWSDGEVTIETWALDDNRAAFRANNASRLLVAGEIALPGVDAASDDALRAAAAAGATQPALDDATRSKLMSLATAPQEPFEPGTHIAIAAQSGEPPVLGTVISALADEHGELSGYEWRPDAASLVGHPWHDFAHSAAASRHDVAATLLPVDRGLPAPDVSLSFGASVRVGDESFTVLRGYDVVGATFSYDVQPVDGGDVRRIGAAEISAIVAGTAWPDAETLIAERQHCGIALVPGERLTTTAGTAWIDADATPSPTRNANLPPPAVDTRARPDAARVGVDESEPLPPPVVKVDLRGDLARVGDPRHGWISIDRAKLMTALADPAEALAGRLRAYGSTRVSLDGHESHVTLAALAAKHLDVAPAVDSPATSVAAATVVRQPAAELTL
jgi:hypothetical protein